MAWAKHNAASPLLRRKWRAIAAGDMAAGVMAAADMAAGDSAAPSAFGMAVITCWSTCSIPVLRHAYQCMMAQ